MQALELKPTDLWQFISLPARFVNDWFFVATVLGEYREEQIRENRE